MDWESHILFDVNDLFDYEPEDLAGLDRIDRRTAVRNLIGARIRRSFGDLDDGDLLSRIENPDVGVAAERGAVGPRRPPGGNRRKAHLRHPRGQRQKDGR